MKNKTICSYISYFKELYIFKKVEEERLKLYKELLNCMFKEIEPERYELMERQIAKSERAIKELEKREKDFAQVVNECNNLFMDKEEQVFELFFLKKLTAKEIACELNLSERTVFNYICKVRKTFESVLPRIKK